MDVVIRSYLYPQKTSWSAINTENYFFVVSVK
jgi:hypothetical protein